MQTSGWLFPLGTGRVSDPPYPTLRTHQFTNPIAEDAFENFCDTYYSKLNLHNPEMSFIGPHDV